MTDTAVSPVQDSWTAAATLTIDALVRAEYDRMHNACEHAPYDRAECCGSRYDRPCFAWCENASGPAAADYRYNARMRALAY